MDTKYAVAEIAATEKRLGRTLSCLEEADSTFTPGDGTMTVAQHVAHVAQTVDWFVEAAFRPETFDLDFEGQTKRSLAVTSLAEARAWLARAFAAACQRFGACSTAELARPLPENPIINGPRYLIVQGLIDHTCHHRGALAVYARLLGRVPAMPYGEG